MFYIEFYIYAYKWDRLTLSLSLSLSPPPAPNFGELGNFPIPQFLKVRPK